MPSNPVIVTGDGSHTIMDPSRLVTYHSMHGAIRESEHVFIRHGLEYVAQHRNEISILEVGFGTGLNALLSYLYTKTHSDKTIRYTGIEKFAISPEIAAQLNYCMQLQAEEAIPVFQQMHTGNAFSVERFHFDLFIGDFLDFDPAQSYDLAYFDAFAPSAQPEMWEPQVFQKLKDCMTRGGVLVTYCAQGQFKRTLKSLGFRIESLPGPPGKREMVRAVNHG